MKFINQDDMKRLNFVDVFHLIRELKQTTRKQLEAITGLSWGAVSTITSRLIENGFVLERKPDESTGPGRTPLCLEVDGSRHFAIGLDVNIMGLEAVQTNLKNEPIGHWQREAEFTDKEALLHCMLSFLRDILAQAERERRNILGLGIAMQGIVDAERGISLRLPKCPGWIDVPVVALLQEAFGLPAWLEHDPNCILLAEAEHRDMSSAILLRIDKGVGMSVMMDGRILGGSGLFEIGHTTAVPDGALCACGNRGCLETYVTRDGIERLSGLPFSQLLSNARANEPAARSFFDDMALYLGIALHNVMRLFNITDILLCGEMTNYRDLFLGAIGERIRSLGFPTVRFTILQGNSAAHGAAMIAIDGSTGNYKIE